VGYWKFDEGGGTTAGDSSGNGNTGTLLPSTSTPTWVTGKVGGALSFDGTNDYVDAGSNSSLDNITIKTVSLWFYAKTIGSSAYPRFATKEDSGSLYGWELAWENPRKIVYTQYLTSFGKWGTNDNIFAFNTWTHLALVYNCSSASNTPNIYINGTSVSVTMISSPGSGSCGDESIYNLILGNRTGGARPFDGFIDDLRIYNRALSAVEIQALHNATK
jgi:hypothetical protein